MSDAVRSRHYVCRACGCGHASWKARCARCGAFDLATVDDDASLTSAPAAMVAVTAGAAPRLVSLPTAVPAAAQEDDDVEPIPLDQVAEENVARIATGLAPLDAVLGGGLVVGSVVLLYADAGCGKSSISLQMAAGVDTRVLYATGEETIVQVADRARRIDAADARVLMMAETDLGKILRWAGRKRVGLVVIDSIQTTVTDDVGGHPGSASQVRVCSERLRAFAKETGTIVWIIGHVTAEGDLAGPSAMKHAVDAVIELDRGKDLDGRERILRCPRKNRFGPTGVTGRFELTAVGMQPIDGDGWDKEKFH